MMNMCVTVASLRGCDDADVPYDRGSLSKITSMIPGMSGMMEDGGEEEAASKLKRMIFITDAMRADELDSDGLIFVSPVLQIACFAASRS